MFIHDMSQAECRYALKHASVGRLACTRDNQPYVVPIYFTYHEHHLYVISTIGQKIEWMRANPLVCVEVDNIASHDDWMSVVVFGRYEELPDVPEFKAVREQALKILQKRSTWWWEPAFIRKNHRDSPHSQIPVAFRIHIDLVSGRHATPQHIEAKESRRAESQAKKEGWFADLFSGHRGIQSRKKDLND